MTTHAPVAKRVVGLHDDGPVKALRAVDALGADYVDRRRSAGRHTHFTGQLDGEIRHETSRLDVFFHRLYLNGKTSQGPASGEFSSNHCGTNLFAN